MGRSLQGWSALHRGGAENSDGTGWREVSKDGQHYTEEVQKTVVELAGEKEVSKDGQHYTEEVQKTVMELVGEKEVSKDGQHYT